MKKSCWAVLGMLVCLSFLSSGCVAQEKRSDTQPTLQASSRPYPHEPGFDGDPYQTSDSSLSPYPLPSIPPVDVPLDCIVDPDICPDQDVSQPGEITPQPDFITGTGDFPRLQLVALSMDNKTPTLYLVEGDTAKAIRVFYGINRSNLTISQSPNGQHTAIIIQGYSSSSIEVINQNGDCVTITQGEHPREGAERVEFTSIAWIDDEHLLYSKQTTPPLSREELSEWLNAGKRTSEVWVSTVDGNEQRLLASGPIRRVLGISRDQQTLYVTWLIDWNWGREGFALLRIGTNELEYLWPSKENAEPYYLDIQLTTLLDRSTRVLIRYVDKESMQPQDRFKKQYLWMGDPESRTKQVIWSGKNNGEVYDVDGKSEIGYRAPEKILWSPQEDMEFVYILNGELWRSNLIKDEEEFIGKVNGEPVAWSSKGIAVWNIYAGKLYLMTLAGQVVGEIQFGYVPFSHPSPNSPSESPTATPFP